MNLSSSVVDRVLTGKSPVLLFGGARSERLQLVRAIPGAGVVGTDLGLPLVGPPGAVSLAYPSDGASFRVHGLEALCTLDAARFRLPLVLSAARLVESTPIEALLVEVPGVSRGMAGAELLTALAETLSARLVLTVGEASFRDELRAAGLELVELEAPAEADGDRAKDRTDAWKEFLEGAEEVSLPWLEIPVVGAPPPRDAAHAWPGRQLGILGVGGRTLGFGEISSVDGERMWARVRWLRREEPGALLVRDARLSPAGSLETEKNVAPPRPVVSPDLNSRLDSSEVLAPPVMSLTTAKALLVNGIFGDPLLHVRLRHRKRSLLFDLGDAARLPARIVHQVTDVFVSHAHFDHFGGFLWFLRSSIGSPRCRRIFGPPGLSDRIDGMIEGILWDRIGDRGPAFEVCEVHGETMVRFRLQAGRKGRERLEALPITDGVLVDEPDFSVRSATLDHGVPVLSYSFEERKALHVRPEAISTLGLTAGPWLNELKTSLLTSAVDDLIEVSDGSRRRAGELGRQILWSRPGEKIVYATDFDDTESNRSRLQRLARGARVFFCEASFLEEDRHLALATQHLTARACGEIALAAGVFKLVPFHFSKRYEHEPDRVYREVREAFSGEMVAAS